MIWTRSAHLHTGPRHGKAAPGGLTHDRTRSRVRKLKSPLAQREASTHDFPDTGLKEARDKAGWVRLQVARGWSAEQVRAALQTDDAGATVRPDAAEDRSRVAFRDVARTWFARKREGLKNGKHIQQNWNTIATYAFPALGHRPVGEIRTLEVVEALRPIWHTKHETARRTLGRISEVFELAKLENGVAVNPADFDPKIAYGRKPRSRGHFGSLPHDRVAEFWSWLEEVRCDELTRQLVMLVVLTAKRTGEARFAQWSHITAPAMWTTPPELMKMGREHRVPLSRQAVAVLRNTHALTGDETHLFAKSRNRSGVICENAALNLVKRFDPTITGHGFRATFRTWARLQKRYERDAYEFALAHGLPPLDEAYMRADLYEERQVLMQDWADFVTGGRMPRDLVAVVDSGAEDCPS